MSQVALFTYATGAAFQCGVSYNQTLFVGTTTSIVLLNPFTGTVLDSKSYAVGVRGGFGFVSAGKLGTTGVFVTSLGTVVLVDLTQSTIVDTVFPGVADTDGPQKFIAISGTTVYVVSFISTTSTLSVWRRYPTDSVTALASQSIATDNITYFDRAPLSVVGGVIYIPGGSGIGGIGFVYTFTIASNTISQYARPAASRTAYTSTVIGTTLFIGGARLLKDFYTWNTLTNTETGSGLLETNPADNGFVASTTDGTDIYILNYANTSLQPFFRILSPTLFTKTSVAMDPSLITLPVVMLYDSGYIYIPYSNQRVSVWFVGTPFVPPGTIVPSQETIPQQYQNIHLASGKNIVPYSAGAVVPPAIPPIPARTIENIKLPNGPKDYRYCRAPLAPYRNVPEPASYPNNPGQRRPCLLQGERPIADYGTPLQTYIPKQGVVTVGTQRASTSRVAATWPPP